MIYLKEEINGAVVQKFPGGGLQIGESPLQCLIRELREELNIIPRNPRLFHVPEQVIYNHFNPEQQVVPLYYRLTIDDCPAKQEITEDGILKCIAGNPVNLDYESFTFSSDREALYKLRDEIAKEGHL